MNSTSDARSRWTDWAATADDDLRTAVRTIWAGLGPVTLIREDPTPSCVNCGGHNPNRYGDGGSPRCLICDGVAS